MHKFYKALTFFFFLIDLIDNSSFNNRKMHMIMHALYIRDIYLCIQFSFSVMSNSLQPHGLQHTKLPCPSTIPRACSNSCPWSQWWHPMISFSVVPFSYCLQSFLASGSFLMSQLLASSGQTIGVSASRSVLWMNNQDWFPLELTGWISFQSKWLSRVFSNTTVQKHQLWA